MSGPGLNVPLDDPRTPALKALRPPAFLMLCVGVLNMLFCLGVLAAMAFGFRFPTGADPQAIAQVQPVTVWQVLTILGGAVSGALSVWGALSAVNLKNWGLAAVGAVATLLPMSPTCCLGFIACPWMLLALSTPEVKKYFGV